MSTTFAHPPRLAVGSHPNSQTYRCAFNVLSWENGDDVITDTPSCSPLPLTHMVQLVNDRICRETTTETDPDTGDHVTVLCPSCSMTVLDLAHATVDLPTGTMAQGWRWTASLLSETFHHENTNADRAIFLEALRIARAKADGTETTPQARPRAMTMRPMSQLANVIIGSQEPGRRPAVVRPEYFAPMGSTGWSLETYSYVQEQYTDPHLVRSAKEIINCAGRMFVGDHNMFGRGGSIDFLAKARFALESWKTCMEPTVEPTPAKAEVAV